ncbi:MAG TPA: DPP IV N-terminal domain-containing protein, partial [Candidatus Angelobacter sp.]
MKKCFLSVFLIAAAFAAATAQELTIQSIYAPNGLTGRAPDTIEWSPDGKKVSYFLHQEQGDKADLYYIDVTSGKPAVLLASEKIAAMKPPVTGTKDDREKDNRERYHVAGYHWAPDSEHILFDANGQLWYFTLSSGKYIALSAPGESATDPKFSTDGKSVSYIRKHNLVVKHIDGGGEKALTTNGDDNLLNGEVDWVYSEELEVRSNYFWSPDSRRIVLLQMDQSKVPTYPITDFIPQHPTVYEEKYPKVGDPNPQVQLGVVNAGGGTVKWFHLTDDKDMYMPRFGWVNDNVIWATVLNRAQNQLDLYFVDATSGKSRRVLTEKSDTWIETDNNLQFLKSGDKFIWPSWRDGHTHLYLYSFDKANPLADVKLVNQITKGDFEVFDIAGVVENTLFVTTNAGDDRQRHLCSVKLDGSGFECLTKGGTHEATVAPNGQYFVDHFSSLMTPPQLSFCHVGGSCDVFWRSKSVDSLNLTPPQFVDFKAEDGTVLRGIIYLPPGSAGKKVPLLNNPYGGPHGQSVRDLWGGANFLFNQILMRDGIAVLVVDNRGMGARGKKF